MTVITLDEAHRSALVRLPAGAPLEVRTPAGTAHRPKEVRLGWAYARWGSETGALIESAPHVSSLSLLLGAGDSGYTRERMQVAVAADAIDRADMPAALIRWEYRDIDKAGEHVRALVAVDLYLPLEGPEASGSDRPYPTAEDASNAHLQGWNLRCNRCGGYGATWQAKQRPGWGALALCAPHARALAEEHARHDRALERLRAVAFEQSIGGPLGDPARLFEGV